MKRFLIIILGSLVIGCNKSNETSSLPEKSFPLPDPTPEMLENYEIAKRNFQLYPDSAEIIIWYGRRIAYLGRYDDAINIFSAGISKYPADARFYRHRGHRYISTRQFDKAINDLVKAGELIEGQENQIEPDGIPNAQNIPISTLHGNIWYHLGLAYYLKHDYENAFTAYVKCRESGSNDDNIVSSTHWLYMIQQRLGNKDLASKILAPISDSLNIIENTSYYQLCKFYKQLIPVDSLVSENEDTPASDAVKYGIANWYFYQGEKKESQQLMKKITEGKSWSSFGFIAAESDLEKYFK